MQTEATVIETTIEDLREKIALAEALDKLHKNAAFKKVFVDKYFSEKPQELARVAAQVSLNERSEQVWRNSLIGISALQGYFHSIYTEAEEAKAAIQEYEAGLTAANAEVVDYE